MDNEKLIRAEEINKMNIARIEKLENKMDEIFEITLSIKELTMEVKKMREDVNKVEERVGVLEEKPAKNWNNLVNQVISIIVAGVTGYFISKFGI